MIKKNVKVIILLNFLLMFYSMSGICSKQASKQQFLSLKFCFYYAFILLLLGIYAIGWQQIIKRLPLTVAFANKAITIVWGLIWGCIFFGEMVTSRKIVGAILVIIGVVLYSKESAVEEND